MHEPSREEFYEKMLQDSLMAAEYAAFKDATSPGGSLYPTEQTWPDREQCDGYNYPRSA